MIKLAIPLDGIDCLQPLVENQRVDFLDACGAVGWHDDLMIAGAARLAAVFPGEQDGGDAEGFRLDESGEHIGAVAAGGEADEHIARFAKRLDAAGKYLFVAVIVADAGDGGGVGVETDGGQGTTIPAITTDELFGQMHGIRRAAAIAAGEELAAVFQ